MISKSRYRIDGKLVFIRMLKDKHVMVRVGGGWDTLANYLLKHDCQNMIRLPTPTRFDIVSPQILCISLFLTEIKAFQANNTRSVRQK